MCTIIGVYRKEKNNLDLQKAIEYSITEEAMLNKDGFAIFADEFGKKPYIKRLLAPSTQVISEALKYNAVHFHGRQATTGEVHENNVHFWNIGEWIFGHNGWVREYSSFFSEKKDKDSLTDSYLFFHEMMKRGYVKEDKIKWDKIDRLADEKSFSGRFVLINSKTKKAYYAGDWNAYLIGDGEDRVLLIASKKISLYKQVNFFGIDFTHQDNELNIITKDLKGVFCINYEEGTYTEILPEFNETTYSVSKWVWCKECQVSHSSGCPKEDAENIRYCNTCYGYHERGTCSILNRNKKKVAPTQDDIISPQ